jgi:acyl-CoA synthetase (AMP-forming)/AMP-acid ligase II
MNADVIDDVTIGELLRRAAERDPSGTALIDARDPARRWAWADLHRAAHATARRLTARHEPGAVVAIWARSDPAWVVLELGCALAGLVVQPIDPDLEPAAVAASLRRTGANALAVDAGRTLEPATAGLLRAEAPALRSLMRLGARPDGPTARWLPTVTPAMGALALPTSGTTGPPKAALLSHRAVTADAALVAARMGLEPTDTWLTAMPLHRSGGCGTTVVACLAVGATMICTPTWAPDTLLALLRNAGVTVLSAFPRALDALTQSLAASAPAPTVRLVQTGGAPVSPALVRAVGGALGARLSVVYGMTEAGPVLTQTDQSDPDDDPAASVGRPLPRTDVIVVDPVRHVALPAGAVGEVRARGPQVMTRYLGDAEATARALGSDGWLRTGDLGWLDGQGRLHVEGRSDDVIDRDGQRWLPGPVERAAAGVGGVAEAVVVGGGGGDVVAFVRPQPGRAVDEDAVRRAITEVCGADMVPDRIVALDELPALPSGKVRRFELRRRLEPELAVPAR